MTQWWWSSSLLFLFSVVQLTFQVRGMSVPVVCSYRLSFIGDHMYFVRGPAPHVCTVLGLTAWRGSVVRNVFVEMSPLCVMNLTYFFFFHFQSLRHHWTRAPAVFLLGFWCCDVRLNFWHLGRVSVWYYVLWFITLIWLSGYPREMGFVGPNARWRQGSLWSYWIIHGVKLSQIVFKSCHASFVIYCYILLYIVSAWY